MSKQFTEKKDIAGLKKYTILAVCFKTKKEHFTIPFKDF